MSKATYFLLLMAILFFAVLKRKLLRISYI